MQQMRMFCGSGRDVSCCAVDLRVMEELIGLTRSLMKVG